MAQTKARLGPAEGEGATLAKEIIQHIEQNGGKYLRDAQGSLHVIINGQRIPINNRHENTALARLIQVACDVSTLSREAQIAIQRLQVHADGKADTLQMRKFSALSPNGKNLYIPLHGGSLVLVNEGTFAGAKNGETQDGFWVEHPEGKPFGWSSEVAEVGLAHFERLLVDTLACKEPAMRWLVAMHEGLFPYVRDLCAARLLLVHTGDSQSGKTSGAARFTYLHGLGDVKGDYTVATLGNVGDIGLLAMDNKEQNDLPQDYINFLLFLSTGAARGRSFKDGRLRPAAVGRPVGVITSIEGVGVKTELRNRCVEVQFAVKGKKLKRDCIEREIRERRDVMNSAIAQVLPWFLAFHADGGLPTPNPIPDFEEHFTVLCDLLRAYAFVADKPDSWAEEIIQQWASILGKSDDDEDILEHPLCRVLNEHAGDPNFKTVPLIYDGKPGKLVVTDCGSLLTCLQSLSLSDRVGIPPTPNGLGKRLRTTHFNAFEVLDDERAPEISHLKRTTKRRKIGFFFEDDGPDV